MENGPRHRLVLCGEGPVEPTTALSWYLQSDPPSKESPVELLFGTRRTPPPIPLPLPDYLSITAMMPGRGLRALPARHRLVSYSQICVELAAGDLSPDVVIACSTPPADGGRSLGGISGYMQLALDAARIVVLEECPSLCHIDGAATPPRSAKVVPGPQLNASLEIALSSPPTALDRQIAHHVAQLIPEGATVAFGVGRIAEAVSDELSQRRNLRVLTGAVTPAIRRLANSGAITTRTVIRAMSVIGDADLLAWASDSSVSLLPSTMIHSPTWLANRPRFTAVLGCFQVDRSGNIGAHRIGGEDVSGLGGAPDFAAGAHQSPGGLSIVAVPSCTRHGTGSLVEEVEAITVPGALIDAVVTEQGAAIIAGLSGYDRARALESVF